jgi:hypothetical protein
VLGFEVWCEWVEAHVISWGVGSGWVVVESFLVDVFLTRLPHELTEGKTVIRVRVLEFNTNAFPFLVGYTMAVGSVLAH